MIIDLLGKRIETVPVAGSGGQKLKLQAFTGWHSSPPVAANIENMPQADGAFDPERTYRGSKVMSITGFATASSVSDAEDLWDDISGLAPLGTRFDVQVTALSGRVRTTTCRVNGQISVDPFTATKAKFMIPLVAADGRKYGPPIEQRADAPGVSNRNGLTFPLVGPIGGTLDFGPFSPTGLVELANSGTAETWPRFLVTGSIGAAGFQIVSGSNIIEYRGPIAVGQSVLLDPYAGGRAFLNGNDVTGEYLTRSEWSSILPESKRSYAFNPIGATDANASMLAQYREAWW